MLAIHNNLREVSFQSRWVRYCKKNNIPYKLVDSFSNDIINELKDCNAFMWHFHQYDVKDNIMAKQLIYALEHGGLKVFPNFKTAWHFDDKVAQKYLFEKIGAPIVPTYVFFDKQEAIYWAMQSTFPKVFKLRGGAGSQNVQLIKTRKQALYIIRKAFGRGFPKYNAWGNVKERWRKFNLGKMPFIEVIKGILRIFWLPKYARLGSNDVGYVYFQDFIPNNDSDTRIIVIDEKAFALKRYVRNNDFRASGSGDFAFERELFDERCVKIAFEVTEKLGIQVGVFDFIFDSNNTPLIVEVSYGYAAEAYDNCPGYWDKYLTWHEGKTIKEEWMVDLMLKS